MYLFTGSSHSLQCSFPMWHIQVLQADGAFQLHGSNKGRWSQVNRRKERRQDGGSEVASPFEDCREAGLNEVFV